jgi:hypothetical protein
MLKNDLFVIYCLVKAFCVLCTPSLTPVAQARQYLDKEHLLWNLKSLNDKNTNKTVIPRVGGSILF